VTYRIQVKENGNLWTTLGGSYDAKTADERIAQFVAACTTSKGQSRQYRVVAVDGDVLRPAWIRDAQGG
jgi:hypothetical protein